MGAAAVQSTMAQQKSNNRLLPESDQGAVLGSAEVKTVGVVLSMIASCDELLWQFRDASRANSVIPDGQMVDPESVIWKCQPLHCFTLMYPSPRNSGKGEDHAAP